MLETANGRTGRYVALSYCWGEKQELMTTHKTLPEFSRRGIMAQRLPATLRDAARVTKGLGISYLWIDSLCINQKDEIEKAKELAKMADIFKNALVTISAAAASDCKQGFLHDRPDILERNQGVLNLPTVDDRTVPAPNRLVVPKEIHLSVDSDLGFNIKDFDEEPINTRAWTLQEAFLSPRLVVYGSGPIEWRCLSRSYTRGVHQPNETQRYKNTFLLDREKFLLPSLTGSSSIAGAGERREILDQWDDIMQQYSRRSMSERSDKLPALSGIATEFHKALNDEYLAGVWKTSLPQSLLWYRRNGFDAAEKDPATPEPKKTFFAKLGKIFPRKPLTREEVANSIPFPNEFHGYVAPSWSPASTNDPVGLYRHWRQDHRTSLASIISTSITPATPIHLLGKVTAGHLELMAPMCNMSWAQLTARFVIETEGSADMYWDYIYPDDGPWNLHLLATAKRQPASSNPQQRPVGGEKLIASATVEHRDRPQIVRPTPQTASDAVLPTADAVAAAQAKLQRQRDEAEYASESTRFWFLEVLHTNAPAGLLLVELAPAVFQRIGYFYMGRNESPGESSINGMRVYGGRDWNWDGGLKMRQIVIV